MRSYVAHQGSGTEHLIILGVSGGEIYIFTLVIREVGVFVPENIPYRGS